MHSHGQFLRGLLGTTSTGKRSEGQQKFGHNVKSLVTIARSTSNHPHPTAILSQSPLSDTTKTNLLVLLLPKPKQTNKLYLKMADDEDIAALVVDNGSGMCKGKKGF